MNWTRCVAKQTINFIQNIPVNQIKNQLINQGNMVLMNTGFISHQLSVISYWLLFLLFIVHCLFARKWWWWQPPKWMAIACCLLFTYPLIVKCG
ncbi:MAG: hypothetical protein AB4426_24385 [Xenococcaceae cyanobacterium]